MAKVANIIDFVTSTGSPLPILASSIELIGDKNGYPYVRTKSGFEHLLMKGDVRELKRKWATALRADAAGRIATVIDVESEDTFQPSPIRRQLKE